MTIRKARADESPKIHTFIMAAVEPHRYEDFDEEGWMNFCRPNEIHAIQARLDNPEYLTLCYLDATNILGLITLYQFEKLDQLFVHPSARRQGIATQLWQAARKVCEADGRKPHYWLKSSTMAVPLYESFGFHLTDGRQQLNGITYYPMEMTV